MNIYSLPAQLHTVKDADRIIAIGVFDGVHIGHRTVLSRALLEHDLTPAVFTFCETGALKSGGNLQTDDERRTLLERLEFADLFEADFAAIKDLSPAQFVDMLKNHLHAKALVCGFNFRFGKNGVGDTALLQALCDTAGIRLYIQQAVEADGQPVSSTRIKQALQAGDMETVLRLQTRPFTVNATVKSGQQLGRVLGSPTINQWLPASTALPRFGVYASLAIVEDKVLPAVTNIGVRPTIGSEMPLAETYILDFNGDLYGEQVPVQFIRFLRPEQKFASVDALKAQIEKDAASARAVFAAQHPARPRAILFDFDNTLQDRQIAFHRCLREWIKKHFPHMPEVEIQRYADVLLDAAQYGFVPYKVVFDKAAEILPWETTPDYAEALLFFKISYPYNTTVFEDATETLLELKKRGYLLGMLTNGNARIQNCKLDMSGLRPLFDYIIVGGEEGIQKPDTEVFRRVALRMGVHPADCVYVGDHPVNDIEGAIGAGMTAVFRDFEYPEVTVTDPTVPHIHSLSDLLTMF